MSLHRSLLAVALLLGLASLPQLLIAQADPAPTKPAAEKADRNAPLPDYWGKIGVSEDQRKKLNTIRGEYAPKLADLRKQIQALEAERDAKMELELTDGQKLRLKELRDEAKQKAAAEAAAKKDAAPAPGK
jgi:hypothetical protein